MNQSLVIRDADIVDGTGRPRRRGDILLEDGVIVSLGGRCEAPTGALSIDAAGLVACPGFIDMHAHSDLAVLRDREHLAKTTQGVTVEVLGQDGLSYAPTNDVTMPLMRTHIAGWNGDPPDVDFSWRSVADYLERIDRGCAVNVAYLIPHGTVRMAVMGEENRDLRSSDIADMRRVIAQGMREGAFGMSAGLSYVPGMFAGTDELVQLCEVVAAYGGYFSPHQRSYGKGALEGYAEMIDIARRSGCPVHLTHATMNFPVNRGRAGEFLALVDDALVDGVDVTLDSYPYLPGSTTLAALLPSWVADGGQDAALARVRDPDTRARIRYDLEVGGSDGCHGVTADWRTIEISGVAHPELAGLVGRTVAQIAVDTEREPSDVFFETVIRDQFATTIIQHVGDENNVRAIMQHRVHTVGSDGLLIGAKPHPRAWGTFPRFLRRYVREERLIELEEAVAHLTSRPARRLGLSDRGILREGYVADLVLFDQDTVADQATFEHPRRPATGIPWVIVAGQPVIADGVRTDAMPGRALRGGWAGQRPDR